MTEDYKNSEHLTAVIFDEQQFDEVRDLFEEDFAGLLKTYIDDSKQRVATMQDAQLTNDNAGCFEAAHALKGASATIGAVQLVALSGQLEEACRDQKVSYQGALIEHIVIALQNVEHDITQRLGR